MSDQISSKTLAEVFSLSPGAMLTLADMLRDEARKKANQEQTELRELISRLLERVTDTRTLKRIYSFTDKLYCEEGARNG